LFAIGTVERDTGIGRDTLRIWERRYGFPSPERNAKGERVYSDDQIRRLQRFRRLLDQGRRPGKVVPLSDAALDALADTLPEASLRPEDVDPAHEHLVALASSGDLKGLNAAILRSGFPTTPRSGTGVCDEPMGLERERVAAEEGACYCDTACRAEPPSDAKRYGHRAHRDRAALL